ncbi:MAG: hypothetical protein ACHP65_02480 [Legionellales bacterium]
MNDSLAVTKVKKALYECELHQKRIKYALNKLKKFMPLTVQHYKNLKEDQIETLDQFLYRFSKLQDVIGQRLFSGILELLEEPFKEMSFLDRLNRLEQLHLIESKEQWLMLRNLRNSLAHEYEDDPQGMCQAINHIYNSYPLLTGFFVKIQDFFSPIG